MRWELSHGNILEERVDVLVCSANVFLNLSGGVGGEILLRCGPTAQEELHQWLKERGRRFVQPGEVVTASPHGLPFKAILHAVAIDAFYHTTPDVLKAVVDKSIRTAASLEAGTVALTALATGFGRLSMHQFAEAVSPLLRLEYPPVAEVRICVKSRDERDELAAALANPAELNLPVGQTFLSAGGQHSCLWWGRHSCLLVGQTFLSAEDWMNWFGGKNAPTHQFMAGRNACPTSGLSAYSGRGASVLCRLELIESSCETR